MLVGGVDIGYLTVFAGLLYLNQGTKLRKTTLKEFSKNNPDLLRGCFLSKRCYIGVAESVESMATRL